MLGLVPVGSAPIGILSLNIRNVANRDVEVDGWNPSVGTVIADTLDEDTPDNSDYSYSSNLDDRQTPLVMALNNPLEAGTYTFNFTAQKETEWGEVKLTLLDSNLTSVGASSWTGLVDRTFNTYSVTATTTATSAFIKVEARSDAALVLDFTDPDKIDKRLISSPYNSEPRIYHDGYYQDKYGFLINNTSNQLYNSSRAGVASWTSNNITIVPDTEYAPDNTLTADKLVENNTTGTHGTTYGGNLTIEANKVYTRSVYLKPAGRTHCKLLVSSGASTYSAVFGLTGAGTVSSATNLQKSSIESLSNGWYRCSITFLSGWTWDGSFLPLILELQTNSATNNYTGDGVSGVFVWGQQFQEGWNATKYINTGFDPDYAWRIVYGPSFKYTSNNVWPGGTAPATNLTYFGYTAPNTTIASIGTELVVSNTNTGQGIINGGVNVTKGRGYVIESNFRSAPGTGGANIWNYGDSTGGYIGEIVGGGISGSATGLFSITTNPGIVPQFQFGSGTTAGVVGAVSSFSIREIERQALGMPFEQFCRNSFLWSTDLTNTSWTAVGMTPILNTSFTSPSGNRDCFTMQDDGVFGSHYISQNIEFTQGQTAIVSVYFQGRIQLRVSDAVGGYWANYDTVSKGTSVVVGSKDSTSTATIEYATNSWARAHLAFSPTTSGSYPVFVQTIYSATSPKNQQYTIQAYPGTVVWGPQIDVVNTDVQTRASIYKPTKSFVVNGGNIHPYVMLDSIGYNSGDPFTVYVEFGLCSRTNYGIIWSMDAPGIGPISLNAFNNLSLRFDYPTYVEYSGGTINTSVMNTIAIRCENNNYAVCLNGVITPININYPIPTVYTRLGIGNIAGSSQASNGYIRRFKFYNRALSDGELLNLTAGDPDQSAGVNLLTTSW